MVDRNAERRTDGILTAVAPSDRILLIVLAPEFEFQVVDDPAGLFRKAVLLDQRQHGKLHRGQHRRDSQYHADLFLPVCRFHFLLKIGSRDHLEEHPVKADRCLHHIRHIRFIQIGIVIRDLLARVFLMLRKVEIGTRMDPFHFLEPKREFIFHVHGSIGIMSQLFMNVKTIVVVAKAKRPVPFHPDIPPGLKPSQLSAGFHEELHLHLLEFPHPEDELAGHDLIAERLADLGDPERDLHTPCFLNVQVVYENTLGRFGPEEHLHGPVGSGTHLGREHQVELADFRPVPRSADRANNFFIKDDLSQLFQIVVIQRLGEPVMQPVPFLPVFEHPLIGLPELLLVERITKPFGRFFNLFTDLVLVFGQLIFDQHVGPVTFFGILVIDQRIVEGIHMAGGFPDRGMHENGRVDPHDILIQQYHAVPPVFFDIIL